MPQNDLDASSNVTSILQVVRQLKQRKAYREAIELLLPLLDSKNKPAELQQLAGELYELQADFNAAETSFNNAHLARTAWLPPMMGLGRVARHKGNLPDALSWFESVAGHDAKHVGALRQRSAILIEMKRFDEAENLLSDGLDNTPNDLGMARLMVTLLLKTGKYARAEVLSRRILKNNPKDSTTWISLFRALRRQKKLDALLDATGEAEKQMPDTPPILGERIEVLRQRGDHEAAMDTARNLRNYLPDAPGQILSWGKLQLDLGRHDRLNELFAEVCPDGKTSQIMMLRAKSAYNQGDFAAATEDLRQILQINPNHFDARQLLGTCLFAVFDLSGIRQHFQGHSVPEWLQQLMLNDLNLYHETTSAIQEVVGETHPGQDRMKALAGLGAEPLKSSAVAYYYLQQLANMPECFKPDETASLTFEHNIIQYWNGTPPDDVAASMATWKNSRLASSYKLFDRDMAYERLHHYCGEMTPDEFDAFNPAIQADLLRLLLLYEDGGIWVNADCIIRRTPPQELLGGANLTLVQAENGMITTSIIAAAPNEAVIKTALDFALEASLSQPEMWHVLTSGTMALSMACARHFGQEMTKGVIRGVTILKMHEVRPYLSMDLAHDYYKVRHITPAILKRLSSISHNAS